MLLRYRCCVSVATTNPSPSKSFCDPPLINTSVQQSSLTNKQARVCTQSLVWIQVKNIIENVRSVHWEQEVTDLDLKPVVTQQPALNQKLLLRSQMKFQQDVYDVFTLKYIWNSHTKSSIWIKWFIGLKRAPSAKPIQIHNIEIVFVCNNFSMLMRLYKCNLWSINIRSLHYLTIKQLQHHFDGTVSCNRVNCVSCFCTV